MTRFPARVARARSAQIGRIEVGAQADEGEEAESAADPPSPSFDRVGCVALPGCRIIGEKMLHRANQCRSDGVIAIVANAME
jgi:hypothetical protein